MIAMAVVSQQCVAGTSDERGNNCMEAGEDLLSRLRYLRQTLHDCHVRVSALDKRVESLHSVDGSPKDVSSPVQKLLDDNETCTKHPHMTYCFMDDSQNCEGADKSLELEDDYLLQNGEAEFEEYSPSTELQSCLTDNHLKHLAQKHASELFNMYWSYSADQKNDPECSSDTKPAKKVVTWSDEYEIFPYYSETCEQNGPEQLESFATNHEYDDAGEILCYNEPVTLSFDNHGQSLETINGNDKALDEDLTDEDEYTYNSRSEYYSVQMDNTLTDDTEQHERVTEVQTTASDFKNMGNSGLDNCETPNNENTEAESKEIVSLSILNDIKNPWFRKAQSISEDSGEKMHSKRRFHTLIRAKKIVVDDIDLEDRIKTEEYSPEGSVYERFIQSKSEEDAGRKEHCQSLIESYEITTEDEVTSEIIFKQINEENGTYKSNHLEVKGKCDEEQLEFNVSSTEELESENASDSSMYEYSSEDDISDSKDLSISEVILPKTDSNPEARCRHFESIIPQDICDKKRKFVAKYVLNDRTDFSKQANMINNKDDVAKIRMLHDLADDIPVSKDSSEAKSSELLDLINKSPVLRRLGRLADVILDSLDSSGVECSKNIKIASCLRVNQGCNTDPVLNQCSSWDLRSFISTFLLLFLLFAALLIIYLIITVPLLVVRVGHGGSSVAI